MADPRIKQQLVKLLEAAGMIANSVRARAVVVLSQGELDWKAVREHFPSDVLLLVACPSTRLPGRPDSEDGSFERYRIRWVQMEDVDLPVEEQITSTLLEAVANEFVQSGDTVVILYAAFNPDDIDTLSVVRLSERLQRFTARDLERLETSVPISTIGLVIDLALEIAREGREGKAVGTMFVVGDVDNVRQFSKPMGLDPFAKVPKRERNIKDRRVREDVKELAQLDGAFIIDNEGHVVASRQWISAPAERLTLSKGLGSRHWAAAAISKATKALAITVSQSTGTVRVFQDGEVVLRLEPTKRRVLKWQEFEYEPPLERLRPHEQPRPSTRGRDRTESAIRSRTSRRSG